MNRFLKNVMAVIKRELGGYFGSPVAYVFIVIFLLLCGFFTFSVSHFYELGQADLRAFFEWHPWIFLFLIPAVAVYVGFMALPLINSMGLSLYTGTGLTLAPAVELFNGPGFETGGQFDVTADGRFLSIEPLAEQQPEPVTVLMNWPAVLDR